MVRVWLMDSSDADQRLPHHLEGSADLSVEDLARVGVLYWKVSLVHLSP